MTIEECWEKHGHLDYLLSDEEWMGVVGQAQPSPYIAILCDCWQAIKDGREKLYDAQREREAQ